MKLEIKHLAPYLPYGLKMTKEDWAKTGILVPWIMTLEKGLQIELDYAITTQAKPILRPLSERDFTSKDYTWNEWEFFFKNHFDVFGLIEKGLAINLNDIK